MKTFLTSLRDSQPFVVAGIFATGIRTLSAISGDDSTLWISAFVIVFMWIYLGCEFRKRKKHSLWQLLLSLLISFALFVLLLPTPLQYLYTDALLWGGLAALIFMLQMGIPYHLGKWILSMLLPWLIAGLAGEFLVLIHEGTYLEFPNGIYLGYNLFFLASALSIFTIYRILWVRPTFLQGVKFLGRICLGSFLGYLVSIPLLHVLLQLVTFDQLGAFIAAMMGRAVCEYLGGGIFASYSLPSRNMVAHDVKPATP